MIRNGSPAYHDELDSLTLCLSRQLTATSIAENWAASGKKGHQGGIDF
jgi:hypothetical protein